MKRQTKTVLGAAACVMAISGARIAFGGRPWFPLVYVLPAAAGWTFRAEDRRREREQKRAAAGLCIRCEYNLAGNTSGVCPECGHPINPELFARLSGRGM